MRKAALLYGIIGLLAGAIIVGATASLAVNNNNIKTARSIASSRKRSWLTLCLSC